MISGHYHLPHARKTMKMTISRYEQKLVRETVLDAHGALYAEYCFELGHGNIDTRNIWTSYCDLYEAYLMLSVGAS